MKAIVFAALLLNSVTLFASSDKIENWKENNLITEDRALDYIYDYAYDMFVGDDGETCEPVLEYATLKEFTSNKEFVVEAELSISNIFFWACTFLMDEQGSYNLKFEYDNDRKRFNIKSVK